MDRARTDHRGVTDQTAVCDLSRSSSHSPVCSAAHEAVRAETSKSQAKYIFPINSVTQKLDFKTWRLLVVLLCGENDLLAICKEH